MNVKDAVLEPVVEPLTLKPLSHRDIDSMISDIMASVTSQFSDVAPERISCGGFELQAIPVDTRRFIRVMSRFIVLN